MPLLNDLIGYSRSLNYKYKVSYLINSISFLLAATFSVFYMFLIDYPIAVTGVLLYLLSTVIVFLLLKRNSLFLAKILIVVGFMLQETSIVFLLFPHETSFNLFYFIVAPITFFIFDYEDMKERRITYILLTLAIILFGLSEVIPTSPYAIDLPDFVEFLFRVISAFGSILSISIVFLFFSKEINHVHKELKQIANTDTLTNIHNRRFFFELGENLFSLYRKLDKKFVLIIFDLDYFKKINDTYGHLTGDAVLKQVSELVRGQIRKGDIFSRYGGEEFALIIKDVSLDEGLLIAEKIRVSIENNQFIGSNDTNIHCTISLGVTEYSKDSKDFLDMIRVADIALYEAKASGRNCIKLLSSGDGE